MESIKHTKKVILYFSFFGLIISLLIFSCTQEDDNNTNTNGGFQGIVNGVLVAINMDYIMDYLGTYTTKTVGINTTAGTEQWSRDNRIYTLYAPFNGSLCAVSPFDSNSLNTIFNGSAKTKIYKTDISSGVLSDFVSYTNTRYFSTVFENNYAYQLGNNSLYGTHIAKYNLFDTIPLWIKPVNSSTGIFAYNILAINNVVFYNISDSICAANGSNGSLLWATKLNVTSSAYGAFMLYNNNKIYFGANGTSANFFCLNAQTGAVIWSKKIISVNRYQPAYSIEGNNLIVAESGNTTTDAKNIYAVDKNTGNNLWSFTANKSIYSCPTIKNNKVFFSAADSNLYCLNASSGNIMQII